MNFFAPSKKNSGVYESKMEPILVMNPSFQNAAANVKRNRNLKV